MIFPTDLKETVIDILGDSQEVDKFIESTDLFVYHFGLGMQIRNHYKLWKDKELEKYIEEDEFIHPDDISYDWMLEAQKQMKV